MAARTAAATTTTATRPSGTWVFGQWGLCRKRVYIGVCCGAGEGCDPLREVIAHDAARLIQNPQPWIVPCQGLRHIGLLVQDDVPCVIAAYSGYHRT
ncbi:MAG: hypothetical protein ACI9MR_005149 [Myxococcota bacterium]